MKSRIIVLASEEDESSQDGTESLSSIQNHETDFVRDTSDTNTKSECSNDADSDLEFEIVSSDEPVGNNLTTGSDEDLITAGTIAAVLCDSSLEAFVTDYEDDTDGSFPESQFKRIDFWACIQCKNQNNNPLFRFCQKCFQERKQTYPPRPRKRRCSKTLPIDKNAASSQDSGISSLTDCNNWTPVLGAAPKISRRKTSSVDLSDISENSKRTSSAPNRKRKHSSGDTDVENKKVKFEEKVGPLPEMGEVCECCYKSVKDGIFIHGKSAHMCFCYNCSKKTWKLTKRCPICNRNVGNIVKVFTS